jgi:hypothetical protein
VVALWHMDEARGATTMIDSSGHGNDGQISNVTTGVSGFSGFGYSFNGSSSIVTVPNSASLNPGAAPLTISAYLQVPANLSVGDYNFLQKGPTGTKGGAYKMEIFGKSGSKFGFPDCAFNGANGGHDRVYGPSSIADGKWHLVVCSLTASQAYLTVDGKSGPTIKRTVDSISNTSPVTVGAKTNHTHFYKGLADEVSISVG